MRNATPAQQNDLRQGGKLLAQMLRELAKFAKPGMTTSSLDARARQLIREAGAQPAFLGFHGYPAALCTSINEEVVHGIPSEHRTLAEGDLLGLDLGIQYHGLFTDAAITVPIGNVSPDKARLMKVTQTALAKAVQFLKPGVTTGDLGALIQRHVEHMGFSIIRDLVGHGVGLKVHEDPMIPNFGIVGKGTKFEEGMVVAVEPMVALGDWHVRTLDDGWTIVTKDGSPSAHFEHTLLITEKGAEVLTL